MAWTILLAGSLGALLHGQSNFEVVPEDWKVIKESEFTAKVPSHYCEAVFELKSGSYELNCPSGPSRKGAITMAVTSDSLFLMSSSGNYLLIERDPARDWSADASWRVTKRQGRLVVGSLEWCRQPKDCKDKPCLDWCSPEDGRLDIMVGPEPVQFGAHRYLIQVGNVFREKGVDVAEFRAIIASFKEVPSAP